MSLQPTPSAHVQARYDTLVQSLSYLDPEAVPDQDLDAPSQQHHEQDMRQAIEAHMLRRLRSQVSSFSPPTAEVVLPVMMTQQQRECYQAQLARAYEILTDPKTPRQNSHRGGQLRMVCSSLKKVGLGCLLEMAFSMGWVLQLVVLAAAAADQSCLASAFAHVSYGSSIPCHQACVCGSVVMRCIAKPACLHFCNHLLPQHAASPQACLADTV